MAKVSFRMASAFREPVLGVQTSTVRNIILRAGKQAAGMTYPLLRHRWRAAESGTAGARAASRPSSVPCVLSLRMNSAKVANTWKTMRPPGVVVSSVLM
nr:hypothetical protein [Streptomyces sp. NRRL F-5755]